MAAELSFVARPEKSTTDRFFAVPEWYRRCFALTSRVAPPIASEIARRIFFTPPRARVRDEDRAALARGEELRIEQGGPPITAWTWGAGPTVLLLHGWGGHAGQMSTIAEAIARAGHRAVALDAPGHGRSGKGLSSVVHFADALERTARLFAPIHAVVGHSLGSAAAMLAMSRGLVVRRAVLVAPPLEFERFWTRFRRSMGVPDPIWNRMHAASERWLKVRFDRVNPAALAPSMKAEALIVHDETDTEVSVEEGRQLAARWSNEAELLITRGLGHTRVLRDPDVIRRTTAFLCAGAARECARPRA